MSASPRPELAALLIAGPDRLRAQEALESLGAQEADAIEIVIVDVAPPELERLRADPSKPITYVSLPGALWAGARAEAVRRASAPAVAFLEEHAIAEPGWAAALIEAHRGPWAAVGYGFRNANPDSYVSRGAMIGEYGHWQLPVPAGEVSGLPGNNVSYKREALIGLGQQLEGQLAIDFNLQEALVAAGGRMYLEPRAVVSHRNQSSLVELSLASHHYTRLMAARRAESQDWSAARRIAYGLAATAWAPAVRFVRLARSIRGRGLARDLIAGLPVIIVSYLAASTGEALGYLLGAGQAERRLTAQELAAARTASG